jgi:hypothetical protein
MTVQQLIIHLQKYYEPTDELAVAWWDKDTVERYVEHEFSVEVWREVVDSFDNGEWGWQDWAANVFMSLVSEMNEMA